MNFFPSLFGCKKKSESGEEEVVPEIFAPAIFLTEDRYQECRARLISVVSGVMPTLIENGYSEGDISIVDYAFITGVDQQAALLADDLSALGYECEFGIQQGSDLFVIIGKSTPIKLSVDSLTQWVSYMCDLGFTHDCEFHGFSLP